MERTRRIAVAAAIAVLASGFAACVPTEAATDGPVIVADAPGDPAPDAVPDVHADVATDLPHKDAVIDAPAEVPGDVVPAEVPGDVSPAEVPGDVSPADLPADEGPDARVIACWGADRWFPTFDRSCATDVDCSVALHQTDCCGSESALGIATDQQAAFDAAEAECRGQYPLCDCASAPTRMDDGLVATDPATIGVACRDGACTSYATDACERAAKYETLDACATAGDCALAFHQVDCCGTLVAWGIAADQAADFGLTEASCETLLPDCKCAQQATQAQDGNASWSKADFAVACDSGHCRSRVEKVPADTCTGMAFGTCGDPALSCQCCPAGGPAQHCMCSTPCTSAADCTDPARPVCNQAGGAEGFCAPADFACCWLCL